MKRKINRGFSVRSIEDECGPPEDTGEHWDEDRAGDVEVGYVVAGPADRARILREYVAEAEYDAARREVRSFADALACAAGFSDGEIRRMLHLKDGAAPAGGWKGDCFRFSPPTP